MSEFYLPSVDGVGGREAVVVRLLLKSLNTVTVGDPTWQNELVTDSSSCF